MNAFVKFATVSALALAVAAPAVAQDRITGIQSMNDEIDDVTRDVDRDQRRGRDADRFGINNVPQGFRGSLALTASGTNGAADNATLAGAGRMTYGIGAWNHLVGFAIAYGEDEGDTNEEKFFATYEANRYFTDQFYVFGVGRYQYDGYLTDADDNEIEGATEIDAFLGFGPGYRVLTQPNQTWRIQAGPGVRYVKEANTDSDTDVGFIVSSRYYYAFNDMVSFTNDTDILGSDENTSVSNDAGLNFRMSDTFSTRISYRTDYNSDPSDGVRSTENTVGLSLVVGF